MTAKSRLCGNPSSHPLPAPQRIRFNEFPQLDLKHKAVLERGEATGKRQFNTAVLCVQDCIGKNA